MNGQIPGLTGNKVKPAPCRRTKGEPVADLRVGDDEGLVCDVCDGLAVFQKGQTLVGKLGREGVSDFAQLDQRTRKRMYSSIRE